MQSEIELTSPRKQELEQKSARSRLFRFVRPLVSVALLGFLFQRIGTSDFLDVLTSASLPLLGLGVLLVVAAIVVSAYKWQWLLIAQGVNVSLWRLFLSYLIGLFFNNFLPTNIGGDVMRIHDIGKHTGKTAEATASVIGERLLAGFALGITAAAGLCLSFQVSGEFTGIVLSVLGFFALLIIVLANERWQKKLGRVFKFPFMVPLQRSIGKVVESMAVSFRSKPIVAWVLVWSLAFHLLVVLLNYVILLALGADVPFLYVLLFVPIISAIQMAPISVNGLGVREGAYAYFFGWAGLSLTHSVAASLIFWLLVMLVSLPGGAIFAARK